MNQNVNMSSLFSFRFVRLYRYFRGRPARLASGRQNIYAKRPRTRRTALTVARAYWKKGADTRA